MSLRDEIIWRSGVVYIILVIVSLAVLSRIVIIQFVEGRKWVEMGENFIFRSEEIQANRGDILSDDGRILASSVPYYNIYIDTRSSGMDNVTWAEGIDGLAAGLERIIGLKSSVQWKRDLNEARRKGERYWLIRRRVNHNQLKALQKLPIFREGRYKGGFIAEVENQRILPNISLASRTIGYLQKGTGGNVVGLEGAYDSDLSGVNGSMIKQRLTGGAWMPVNDASYLEPHDGNDIVTTINIDIQDVAEHALYNQLKKHNAHHGVAILMEVRSGDIKAIVNLEKGDDGDYHESYNWAIGESSEPGSTFKLASFMAALEDGLINLEDSIDTGKGEVKYYDKVIRDSHKGGYGKITVREVFEKSSNVGTSMLIYNNYKDNPQKFVDRLYHMGLNRKLGIDIKGEGAPLIRYPGDKYWSGISLPMMSHGYEIQMTPLQILTFYNAVANNGQMVKPRFVKSVSYHGSIIRKYDTEVLNPSICSRQTIQKARELLEGVVQNGTATNLKDDELRIAGKTGTAQIANEKYGYRQSGKVSYKASFCGYFPSDNPVYSAIVVVTAPSNSIYYGNLVAGPVFREIADKVYSTQFYRELTNPGGAKIPAVLKGSTAETGSALKQLGIKNTIMSANGWSKPLYDSTEVTLKEVELIDNLVPDVTGMGLEDALYLLENRGLRVVVNGRGRVTRQSIRPGLRISRGQTITIDMRM